MIAEILFFLAACFYFIAGLGLVRLPDALSRLHAGTKASSLATLLAMAAAVAAHPGVWTLLLALAGVGFVFLTAPLASHAISRALLAGRLRLAPKAAAASRPGSATPSPPDGGSGKHPATDG